MLQFHIESQEITLDRECDNTVYSGAREFLRFSTSFSEEWQDYFIIMRFWREGEESYEIADLKAGEEYFIPHQVMAKPGAFYVSCLGIRGEHSLATVSKVRIDVEDASLPEECLPASEADPTLLSEFLRILRETADSLYLSPVVFRREGGYLQWKREAEEESEYRNLLPLSSIIGPQGEQGERGETGYGIHRLTSADADLLLTPGIYLCGEGEQLNFPDTISAGVRFLFVQQGAEGLLQFVLDFPAQASVPALCYRERTGDTFGPWQSFSLEQTLTEEALGGIGLSVFVNDAGYLQETCECFDYAHSGGYFVSLNNDYAELTACIEAGKTAYLTLTDAAGNSGYVLSGEKIPYLKTTDGLPLFGGVIRSGEAVLYAAFTVHTYTEDGFMRGSVTFTELNEREATPADGSVTAEKLAAGIPVSTFSNDAGYLTSVCESFDYAHSGGYFVSLNNDYAELTACIEAGKTAYLTLTDAAGNSGYVLSGEKIPYLETADGLPLFGGVIRSGDLTLYAHFTPVTVTEDGFMRGRVTFAELDGAVTGARLADGAVTTEKLASGAVNADKIAAGAITDEQIYPHSLTSESIAYGGIHGMHLTAGTVGTEQITAAAVTREKLSSDIPLSVFENDSGYLNCVESVYEYAHSGGYFVSLNNDYGEMVDEIQAGKRQVFLSLTDAAGNSGYALEGAKIPLLEFSAGLPVFGGVLRSGEDIVYALFAVYNYTEDGFMSGRVTYTKLFGDGAALCVGITSGSGSPTADKTLAEILSANERGITVYALYGNEIIPLTYLNRGVAIFTSAVSGAKVQKITLSADTCTLQTQELIEDYSLTDAKLASDAIITDVIADGAVTAAKLDSSAVPSLLYSFATENGYTGTQSEFASAFVRALAAE